MSEKLKTSSKEWKSVANKRRTRGLIGTELLQIFEIYDDISVARHLSTLMRSRGKVIAYKEEKYRRIHEDGTVTTGSIQVPVYKDFHHLGDEESLKEIESYRLELDTETLNPDNE